MLESVREKMFDEWLPQLRLEPAVSVKTWQALGPRCSVCAVGYVRFRSTIARYQENPLAYVQRHGAQQISQSDEITDVLHLCLACAVRKELFQQSKAFFPITSQAAAEQVAWPFLHRKNIKASTLPAATYSFLSGPSGVGSAGAVAPRHGGLHAIAAAGCDENHFPGGVDAGSSLDSVSVMSWDTGLGTNHPSTVAAVEYSENTINPHNTTLTLRPDTVTELQAALSGSPVKSRRLQELDAQEAWEQQHPIEYPLQLEDDMSSIQSTGSMFSLITGESALLQDRDSDGNTISVASTATQLNPSKKPKELALLPFLLAKGHYEEAERTLRIALGKQAVDEGEGLQLLVALLTLQAEMYKSMGLWPLALGIYFDCVDMNASLMGFGDPATQAAVVLLVACLRKMQCVQLAGKYVKALCVMVEAETLRNTKLEIVEKIKKQDGYVFIFIYCFLHISVQNISQLVLNVQMFANF